MSTQILIAQVDSNFQLNEVPGIAILPIGGFKHSTSRPLVSSFANGNLDLPWRKIPCTRISKMYRASRLISSARPTAKKAIQQNGDPTNSTLWHSRGYLPHFEVRGIPQMVTFHLSDSLPRGALRRMESELNAIPAEKRDVTRRRRLDALTDAGLGSCILRLPRIAELIQLSLLGFDAQRYRAFAWVVMPNHVHVLFQPLNNWTVASIVSSWKKFTARQISAAAEFASEKSVLPVCIANTGIDTFAINTTSIERSATSTRTR